MYKLLEDIEIVKELRNLSDDDLTKVIGISRGTLNNWRNGKSTITDRKMDSFYRFAFDTGVRLNKIKEQLYREDYVNETNKILFHGAKTTIEGTIDVEKSRKNNDFGKGFYCGESLEQSAMFVSTYPKSSLYILNFDSSDLAHKIFAVDREWMLTIAYHRGRLGEYQESSIIKNLIANNSKADYYIAPIADNRMFEIIDSFIDGEITDVQCQHCLSATNLGNQYVFVTEKALKQVNILEHCYLANEEKEYYLKSRMDDIDMNRDKVKLARKQYRGQGKYIEEILI